MPERSGSDLIAGVEAAYAYCVEHDHWPDGFFPANAIRDLLRDVRAYRAALTEHHNFANLSDAVLDRYDWRSCPVCNEAARRA